MSQSFWKVYKAKVLQTFNTEQNEEAHEESDTTEIIEPENQENGDEGLNMSQLARKVQGTFGWRTVTSLFTREEQETDQRVEQASEMETEETASSRTSDNPPQKSSSALWDVFTSRWQQSTVQPSEAKGVLEEPPEEHSETHHVEETPFKWGFLTSKLAELRSKNE
ncbi:uncharacterized protein C1orf232 homolog [Bufo bufo]|uniref:uncharacterized protein C1orf232 homolog n=1 Tax=Bufo bufo TaxID=8384 RepID=UPI001ABED509|nr:uncharacterized protein C1orf232 homolog [Bufo bufo]XP_040277826.1 uncharacterized protein C1orf232 homolog [Bufo bufo]